MPMYCLIALHIHVKNTSKQVGTHGKLCEENSAAKTRYCTFIMYDVNDVPMQSNQ